MIIQKINEGAISGKMAKSVFEKVYKTGADPAKVIDEMGAQITDTGALDGIVSQILSDNPAQVEQFRSGKEQIIGYFVGQVMKVTRGRANPQAVNRILREKLSS